MMPFVNSLVTIDKRYIAQFSGTGGDHRARPLRLNGPPYPTLSDFERVLGTVDAGSEKKWIGIDRTGVTEITITAFFHNLSDGTYGEADGQLLRLKFSKRVGANLVTAGGRSGGIGSYFSHAVGRTPEEYKGHECTTPDKLSCQMTFMIRRDTGPMVLEHRRR